MLPLVRNFHLYQANVTELINKGEGLSIHADELSARLTIYRMRRRQIEKRNEEIKERMTYLINRCYELQHRMQRGGT